MDQTLKGKAFLRHSRPTQRAVDTGESVRFQAVFYALAFFQLDGFAVPAPAQVTPTVGRLEIYAGDWPMEV
jgi:hypothetical protein